MRSPTTQGDGVGPLGAVHAHDVGDGGDIGLRHGRGVSQSFGWTRCRFIIALTAAGRDSCPARVAVTAIRGAMRTGRVRAAVTIQSAASAALSAGRPS